MPNNRYISFLINTLLLFALISCSSQTAHLPETSQPQGNATVEQNNQETIDSQTITTAALPTTTEDLPISSQVIDEIPLDEERTLPEPEATVALEVKELEALGTWVADDSTDEGDISKKEVEYDFPVTINRQVDYYLDFFQNKQHQTFKRWLSRSGRYVPMISKELKKAGLPTDLAYLPMIESGYSLTAYSRAKAVGPWQFMRRTGMHFGLKVNDYVDDRRDPVKSTHAAIDYLSELYSQFNSWHLAVAAYNAGEGKIHKGIKRYKTKDFWELAQKKRYLPLETKRYVPKLIAAIIIAKSPEKYGFHDIKYQKPMAYETADVPRWTSLKAVAVAIGSDTKELQDLNQQLRKGITPPSQAQYKLKLPIGGAKLVAKNLPRVHSTVATSYKTHVIKRNDTIGKICRRYNINKTTLLKANNLRKAKLTAGKRLRIPYRVTKYTLLSDDEFNNREQLAKEEGDFILHKIRKGESLSKIARRYNVSTQQIAAWNGLSNVNKIRKGQQLALYVHQEKTNNSSRMSAQKPSVNKKDTRNIIISATNKKRRPSREPSIHSTYYKVRGGDSLWRIARRFKLNTSDIKKWNNLRDNTIHPGLKLLLKVERI